MTKREITLVAFGAVAAALGAVAALLAYGVFVSPSAEVPEVPSEPTVAEIDSERMKLEADQAYLLSEMASLGLLPYSSVACGNQYTPETRAEALKDVRGRAYVDEEKIAEIQGGRYIYRHGRPYLPCEALLEEYELRQRRLDQLPRERVQAQLRERERE